MKPDKKDFLDDLDNDRDWIHTEVLGQGRKRSSILPIVTFVLVLVCFGLLAYIAFKGGLSKQDLSNLDNLDKIKQAQQTDDAASAAAKKLAEEQAAAAAKAAEDQTLVYTVKSGDTLASIGDEYGVDFKKIAEANGLAEPYNLDVGMQLKIPGVKKPATETPVATETDGGTTYTVKSGDTLAGIGIQLGIDYSAIATLNNLQPPYALEVGQVLKIPKKQ